jgi:hypothetical protein
MKRPKPLRKLSRLQRLILVMLLDEHLATLGRREFRRVAKWLYWNSGVWEGCVKASVATSDLSRALSRLEARGYLVRTRHSWRLTEFDLGALTDCGGVMAINAWSRDKELYAKVGLRGPSAESLGIQKTGVQVQLDC